MFVRGSECWQTALVALNVKYYGSFESSGHFERMWAPSEQPDPVPGSNVSNPTSLPLCTRLLIRRRVTGAVGA